MGFPEYPQFECGADSCASRMLVHALGDISVDICVMLEAGADTPSKRQLSVIESLAQLSPKKLREDIAIAARNYFREVDARIGLTEDGIRIDENQIEKHYRFSDITIPKHNDCDTDFAIIGAECDWDDEHGMYILLADGRIVYCGSCATLYFGSGWSRVISANGSDSCAARLTELLIALRR